jgi:ankyrin repeat protein
LLTSDDGGQSTLHSAARGGFADVVDYLIDASADIRAASAKNGGVTVLEAAAAAGLEEKKKE